MVSVQGKRFRFDMCVDPDCPSKDEWKKRMAEQNAKKEAEIIKKKKPAKPKKAKVKAKAKTVKKELKD